MVAEEIVLEHGAHVLRGGAAVGFPGFLPRSVGFALAEIDGGGHNGNAGLADDGNESKLSTG